MIPPTAPGLGVELNEAVALAHAYVEDGPLHLEMIEPSAGLSHRSRRHGGHRICATASSDLGHLGQAPRRQLARGGFEFGVHDLHRGAADAVLAAGARWVDPSPSSPRACDCLITCLPSPGGHRGRPRAGTAGHAPRQHLDRDEHQRFRRGRGPRRPGPRPRGVHPRLPRDRRRPSRRRPATSPF